MKRFISYVGKVKLNDLPEEWRRPVDDALTAIEQQVRFPTVLFLTTACCLQVYSGSKD